MAWLPLSEVAVQLCGPFAEPFTLGISAGVALAGAAGTLVLVWRLARIGKHLPPATVVLTGVLGERREWR